MASCLPSFCVSIKPPHKHYIHQAVRVRAQSFGDDEGNYIEGS
jgi:hypothetical protein